MTVGFTAGGYGTMSRKLHAFENNHLLPGRKTGRVLYNSWEAILFDVRVESQKELARRAAKLGVELFVIDDGWFGQRYSDRAGQTRTAVYIVRIRTGYIALKTKS